MICRLSRVSSMLVAAILPLAGLRAAAPLDLDSLVRNSPFGGLATTAGTNHTDQPLEFRGLLMEGGQQLFSMYDVSSRTSLWIGLNEPGNPYKIQSYDEAKAEVTVDYKGRILTLPIKQAKIVTLVQAPPPPQGPNPGPMVGGMPQNLAAATPAEEATRLAAVAEEIRRRRALRAAPPQQQPGGPMPMPGPPRN